MTPRTNLATATGDRCPLRTCRARLDIGTDPLTGRLIVRCHSCERRQAGVCRRCALPVAGTKGKAVYCAAHKAIARQEQQRASELRNIEQRRERERLRQRRPEVRARRAVTKRAWYQQNKDKKREYTRRYHLKRTPGYVAGYTRNNRRPDRAEQKRQQALAKYYALNPERPQPVCRICGTAIPYNGVGRPRVTCASRNRCANAATSAHHPEIGVAA